LVGRWAAAVRAAVAAALVRAIGSIGRGAGGVGAGIPVIIADTFAELKGAAALAKLGTYLAGNVGPAGAAKNSLAAALMATWPPAARRRSRARASPSATVPPSGPTTCGGGGAASPIWKIVVWATACPYYAALSPLSPLGGGGWQHATSCGRMTRHDLPICCGSYWLLRAKIQALSCLSRTSRGENSVVFGRMPSERNRLENRLGHLPLSARRST
jgi:hypothetical protein